MTSDNFTNFGLDDVMVNQILIGMDAARIKSFLRHNGGTSHQIDFFICFLLRSLVRPLCRLDPAGGRDFPVRSE